MVLNSRIDRRPRRSESAPTIGEKTNPMPEYTASSIPVVTGEAPNRSAYNGSTGMTMPKPTISMKTVKSKIGSGDKSLLPDLCKRLDFMGLALLIGKWNRSYRVDRTRPIAKIWVNGLSAWYDTTRAAAKSSRGQVMYRLR